MNRYQLRYFLYLLIIPFLLVSCGDDDDEDVSPNVSLLTSGQWHGAAIIIDGEDITNELLEQEDFDFSQYTTDFKREGTYNESYQGQTQIDGRWEYQNNERIIVFDKGTADEYYVVIAKLDDDELWYVQDGVEYRFAR